MDGTGPGLAPTLARPLELVERSLAWTLPALAAVPGHSGAEPTPCAQWDLTALLVHMVDGFTAFVEGSARWLMPAEPGTLPPDAGLLSRRLLDLGCAILSGWTTADGRDCRLGLLNLPAGTLLEVAALEIAVHGWDVSRVCAPDRQMPPALAAALFPVALRHVAPSDRPVRFGPVVESARRDPAALLLAHLGRRPG